MTPQNPDARIHVYHATAPTCWWSWGYEPVLNRLPLVYGDQVEIHLALGCVYTDVDEYLRHYDLTIDGLNEWQREAAALMGAPLGRDYARADFPPTLLPATLAVVAAREQGEAKAARLGRELLRRFCVEKAPTTTPEALDDAARASGIDVARFRRALAEPRRLEAALEREGAGFPHVPLGFYNLVLADGRGRVVVLDHAFDPRVVEEAIDYLGGGRLEKRKPTDVGAYLRAHGPATEGEIARAFALAPERAREALSALAARGEAAATLKGGVPFWAPVATARSRAI